MKGFLRSHSCQAADLGFTPLFLLLYHVASLCGAPYTYPSDRPQRINACQSGPFRVHQVTLGIAVSIQEPNQLPSTCPTCSRIRPKSLVLQSLMTIWQLSSLKNVVITATQVPRSFEQMLYLNICHIIGQFWLQSLWQQ